MGRPRGFDEDVVLAAAHRLFTGRGYEATSVDDLVQGTGVHRGSLYKAFGSKRGLFVAVLRDAVDQELSADGAVADDLLDLLLVAALEVAPRDHEVGGLLRTAVELLDGRLPAPDPEPSGDTVATVLGRRLLQRADLPAGAVPADVERRA